MSMFFSYMLDWIQLISRLLNPTSMLTHSFVKISPTNVKVRYHICHD